MRGGGRFGAPHFCFLFKSYIRGLEFTYVGGLPYTFLVTLFGLNWVVKVNEGPEPQVCLSPRSGSTPCCPRPNLWARGGLPSSGLGRPSCVLGAVRGRRGLGRHGGAGCTALAGADPGLAQAGDRPAAGAHSVQVVVSVSHLRLKRTQYLRGFVDFVICHFSTL